MYSVAYRHLTDTGVIKMTNKRISIIIIITLVLVSTILMFTVSSPSNNSQDKVVLSTGEIRQTIVDNYKKDGENINPNSIIVDKILYHTEVWILTRVTHLDEPIESKSRVVAYILKMGGENKDNLTVVARSSQSFSEVNPPKGIPSHVIERAKEL